MGGGEKGTQAEQPVQVSYKNDVGRVERGGGSSRVKALGSVYLRSKEGQGIRSGKKTTLG